MRRREFITMLLSRHTRRREFIAGLTSAMAFDPSAVGGEAGILLNEHVSEDGPTVFAHACRLGAEGIVSKNRRPGAIGL
jgi:ATP-dependent DNA ligase